MSNKKEELQKQFIDQVDTLVRYWVSLGKDPKETADGVAFSIMNILDGNSGTPPYAMYPIDEHGNIDTNCDIAGYLHELYSNRS
jgi:hypothetical protein